MKQQWANGQQIKALLLKRRCLPLGVMVSPRAQGWPVQASVSLEKLEFLSDLAFFFSKEQHMSQETFL